MVTTENICKAMEMLVNCGANREHGCENCCLSQDIDIDIELASAPVINTEGDFIDESPFSKISVRAQSCFLILHVLSKINFYKEGISEEQTEATKAQ